MYFHFFRLLVFAGFLVASASHATPVPPAVRGEINALLDKLLVPGCQFNRNGSWYSGPEAKTHLLRKLEQLEKTDLVKTTEDFVVLGASTSSSSGKAYQVRCGNTPPVQSRAWLENQLKRLRQTQ